MLVETRAVTPEYLNRPEWSTDIPEVSRAATRRVSRKGLSVALVVFLLTGLLTGLVADAIRPAPAAAAPVAPTVTSIDTDGSGSCLLDTNQKIYCWGDASAQPNYPTEDHVTRPLPLILGANTWKSVSSGYGYTCAVNTAGAGYCWGHAQKGKLGNGTSSDTYIDTPQLVSGSHNWSSISAGQFSTCGITTAGAAYCWGAGDYGSLGRGSLTDSSVPVLVSGGGTWTSISAGYTTCGIKTGGTGYCWGENFHGSVGNGNTTDRTTPYALSGTWSSISGGDEVSCGVRTSGAGLCWGYNGYRALGNGTATDSSVPTAVAGSGTWRSVSAGMMFSCGVKTDNSAWCWGDNTEGQIGDGTYTARSTPVRIGSSIAWSAIAVNQGESYEDATACGRSTSGAGYCWGINDYGQIGDGSEYQPRSTPTAIDWPVVPSSGSDMSIQEPASGTSTLDFTVYMARASADAATVDFATADGTALAGSDYVARTGTLTIPAGSTQGKISVTVNSDALREPEETFSVTLSNANWNMNLDRTVLTGTIRDRYSASAGPTAASIGAGGNASCLLDSTQKIYCWGSPEFSALGVGEVTSLNGGRKLAPTLISTKTWKQLTVGVSTACAIDTADDAFCWGDNEFGALGDGSVINRPVPTAVSGGLKWKSIAAGTTHTCGVTTSNIGYCWGGDDEGQLGDNSALVNRLTPTAISGGFAWTSIDPGNRATCGIRNNGAGYCWGDNLFGEVGDNTTIDRPVPTLISGYTWKSIDTGTDHSCGVTTAGAGLCWGQNYPHGSLGDGAATNYSYTPTSVGGGHAWNTISIGGYGTCGIRTDARLLCWGDNDQGQLGNGTKNRSLVPAFVSGAMTFSSVDLSKSIVSQTACAVTVTGAPYCWGDNDLGQVGDNTESLTIRVVPTPVAFPVPRIFISAGDVSGSEPLSGNSSLTFTFYAERLLPTAATFNYTTADGTAVAGTDYTSASGTFTFPAGTKSSTLTVPVRSDSLVETNETFLLNLSTPSDNIDLGRASVTATINNAIPATPPAPSVTQLASGRYHSCLIDETKTAFCWGNGGHGALGNGDFTSRSLPTRVNAPIEWKSISVGLYHSCGISTADVAYCWGSNTTGALGTGGASTPANTPTAVAGGGTWTALVAGGLATCGIRPGGAASCWGVNDFGQLGVGDTTTRNVPTTVLGGRTWQSVVPGVNLTCGLSSSTVLCWGNGEFGGLGNGTNVVANTPQTTSITNGKHVTVGTEGACAITTSNQALCWGINGVGQVGDGTHTNRTTPVSVFGGHSWSDLSLGGISACGITTAGKMLCWGVNYQGNLGDGTLVNHALPSEVAGNKTWKSTVAIPSTFEDSQFRCAVDTSNAAYCWGLGQYGQIGNGSTATRLSPTPVAFPLQPVSVSIADQSIIETDSGSAVASVTVSLGSPAAHALTVGYSTVAGTASAGVDFTATTGVLTVPQGSTSATIDVPIAGDTIYENDETLTVQLANPSWNANIIKPAALVTIVNNDKPSFSATILGTATGASCNGVVSNITTSGSTFNGASMRPGQPAIGVFRVVVDTNSYRGFTARVGATPLTRGPTQFAPFAASNAFPAAGLQTSNEAFAIPSGSNTLTAIGAGPGRFAGTKWSGLASTPQEVAAAPGPGPTNTCIAVIASAGPATIAGNYSSTLSATVEGLF